MYFFMESLASGVISGVDLAGSGFSLPQPSGTRSDKLSTIPPKREIIIGPFQQQYIDTTKTSPNNIKFDRLPESSASGRSPETHFVLAP